MLEKHSANNAMSGLKREISMTFRRGLSANSLHDEWSGWSERKKRPTLDVEKNCDIKICFEILFLD